MKNFHDTPATAGCGCLVVLGSFFSRLVTLEKRVKETGLLKDTFCLVGMKTYSLVVELNKIDYTFEESGARVHSHSGQPSFFSPPRGKAMFG